MILVRALGRCVIQVEDTAVTADSEVVFGLLLYLTVHAGRPVARRTLVDLFWPTADDRRARHCLRQTIYRLRGLRVPLRTTAATVTLSADVVARDVDALELQITSGDIQPAPGPCLPGYAPTFSAAFAEWVERERGLVHANLRRVFMGAIGG